MSHRKFPDSEWTWQDGRAHASVRWFPQQRGLIWSRWVETSSGPQYDDGLRQTAEDFLSPGPPEGRTPPSDVIETLHAVVSGVFEQQTSNGFRRLVRRVRRP